ncbi:MAG: hypothetical protein ACYCU7_18615 [Acidimicrobiales bacterium]
MLDELEELVETVRIAAEESARAEAAFKAAFAKSRMTFRVEAGGRPTVDAVDDFATVETEGGRLRYLLARERLVAAREASGACRSRLDALRTLAASVRTAAG